MRLTAEQFDWFSDQVKNKIINNPEYKSLNAFAGKLESDGKLRHLSYTNVFNLNTPNIFTGNTIFYKMGDCILVGWAESKEVNDILSKEIDCKQTTPSVQALINFLSTVYFTTATQYLMIMSAVNKFMKDQNLILGDSSLDVGLMNIATGLKIYYVEVAFRYFKDPVNRIGLEDSIELEFELRPFTLNPMKYQHNHLDMYNGVLQDASMPVKDGVSMINAFSVRKHGNKNQIGQNVPMDKLWPMIDACSTVVR